MFFQTARKSILVSAAFALAFTSLALGKTPGRTGKPNFIIIFIDDMGYGDIGPFGSKVNRMPHLDKLAGEGMRLTSFYSAPLCSASRAQLMTGCYAKRVGIPDVMFPMRNNGLHADEKTLPELLKAGGYATMCIGKWHLGDQAEFLPTRQGFDHYFGLPYSNNMDGTGKPFEGKNAMPPLPLLRDLDVIEAPAVQDTLTRRYTEEAVRFIGEKKDQPFFLYLPHTAVHGPLHPGAEFKGKSANGPYGDWVEEVDWSVGRIMAALQQYQLDRNTLVIFTSDNGATGKDGSNAPLRGAKGSTWEGGMRVPAIARWPGKITAGSSSDAITGLMDVLPTLVRLTGEKVSNDRKIDGLDIWPVLSGAAKESAHEALHYFLWGELQAVRSGPWKLVISPQEESTATDAEVKGKRKDIKETVAASLENPRLYHLLQDAAETTDVAGQHPAEVKRLLALVTAMDADLGITKKSKASGVRPSGRSLTTVPLRMSSSR